MTKTDHPQIKKIEGLKEEHFGGIFRQVFFSPETNGNRYLKMAYIDVPPGARGNPACPPGRGTGVYHSRKGIAYH